MKKETALQYERKLAELEKEKRRLRMHIYTCVVICVTGVKIL